MENRSIKPDKTVLKSLGQCSFAGNSLPSAVDIKDGKILRIRPFHFDEKYTRDEIKRTQVEGDPSPPPPPDSEKT